MSSRSLTMAAVTVALAVTWVGAALPSRAAIVAFLHLGSDQNGGGAVPASAANNITNAMNAAVNLFNSWSDYSNQINVYYNSNVGTADGNINGTIRFGAGTQYHNANVAFHEVLHVLGGGTYWNWQPNVDNNAKRWLGAQGIAMSNRYFPGRALVADYHIWWVDGAGTDMTRQGVHIMGAVRADMGLSNTNVGVVDGDFTGDGAVTIADYQRLRANVLGNFSTLTPAQSLARGDMSGDRRVNHTDFAAFREAYQAANGVGSFETMLAQIPEPGSLALAVPLLVAAIARAPARSRDSAA